MPPPYNGPPLHMSEVFTECEQTAASRVDFHKGLLSAVYGIKAYINSVREDYKTLKMRPGQQATIKANIDKKS